MGPRAVPAGPACLDTYKKPDYDSPSFSSPAATAARNSPAMAFPDWIMLDCYVFRDGPFPHDDDPTAAVGHNSRGDEVRVCFRLRAPPFQMGYLVSLRPDKAYKVFDYLLYRAGAEQPSLDLLAPLGGSFAELQARLEADGLIRLTNQRLRKLKCLDIGVLCRDDEEFVVAELQITRSESGPELHVLRSATSDQWEVKRPLITPVNDIALDLEQFLWDWDADTVIPFGNYLCWVDYCLGILFCDVFDENLQLQYLEFPADGRACLYGYQTVGVTDGVMKFVAPISDDGLVAENFTPAVGFTIICWILRMDEMDKMMWEKETVLKSDLLWSLDLFKQRPHHERRVQFPLISIDEPSVIYLVLRQNGNVEEAGYNYDETWLLAIDMSKKNLKMSFPYIK
ncbi:hypothetical protein E2562_013659 [Oryza meyeriana var. granulata]|uniref:DUF1618 domain-containing protein n=1 Tax=Oryza meyeriana var. granulata TaxID=110450 RepID=A0A6G1BLA2_9ORYZ|nr:hypothetical protein E2562_013659 [Oryza meyeriana var. granulata]